ncbi:hypothetical protein TrLO_g13076 [Triparma laevis f. longispina]|uniref:EGF-like domain-containing protein n=1 Tax=Triparma laevis f. longispina TaxID=1714387 RepID=A0A9W7KWY0_9STRA|nr:hypothetical protein TrLO_g13076 [Triparma laevis f. longispina]
MLLRLLVTVVTLFPTFATAATCIACIEGMGINGDVNELFYCINGGTAGGTPGSCTCTSCNEGFGGPHCEINLVCVASADGSDDGSDGNFWCENGGTAGGVPGSCTCTNCTEGFGGSHCELPACVTAGWDADTDGIPESVYCINGGTAGGFLGDCTCTDCDPGFSGPNCASTSSPTPSPTRAPVLFTPNTFEELYNKVSSNGGNSIMSPDIVGDIVELATGEYKCSKLRRVTPTS